jgi:hypothetical protein
MDGTEQKDVDYSNLIRAQTREVDLDSFRERGMKKVNVINARKINELISEAVTNIIGRMEDADIETIKEDKAQIVMDSMAEFKRLFSETKQEKAEQDRLQEELRELRETLAKSAAGEGGGVMAHVMEKIGDDIAELKAFMINQAGKAQAEEMTRAAMLEEQASLLDQHFSNLQSSLSGLQTSPSSPVAATDPALADEVAGRVAQMMEAQGGREADDDIALVGAIRELRSELGRRFDALAAALTERKDDNGNGAATDLQELVKEMKAASSEGLKTELAALRKELKTALKDRDGGKADDLKAQIQELATEIQAASTAGLKSELSALRDELKTASTESLKAEIAALRDDLEARTVAAGAASTEALQAQLSKMEEMIQQGGGGGGFSGDISALVSQLEGSMSKKLAEAGIGKQEVTESDAVAASGVMLGAAFRDMDNVESNIEGLDAKKTVDKAGAKKAKGALDALKKLKGGG